MGRAWLLFIAVAGGFIAVMFLMARTPPFVWGLFLAFVACMVVLYICTDRIRQAQFLGWWGRFEDRMFFGRIGQLFARRWGRNIARQELEKHLDEQRRERAIALAQRFDLVGHGAAYVGEHSGPEAGADFAEACGRADVANEFLVSAYQRHLAEGRVAMAAEAADQADLYAEAHRAWHEVPQGAGRLRAAKLSERLGYPKQAIRDYVEAEHGGDALRLAEARGLERELIDAAGTSSDPAVWRIAGELCMKREEWTAAVGFLRRANDLRMTLLAAKRGGLDDVVREITAILDAQREDERKGSLPGGYFGPA